MIQALPRSVPVYGKFGALDHGRGHPQPQRTPQLSPRIAQAAILQGHVRPEALKQLESAHLPTSGLRSKSWDEFAVAGAPQLDFVFTVCDHAANEVCPVWPGQPMTAHWGVPDPPSVQGLSEQVERVFREAFFLLDRRIGLFLSLPLSTLDRFSLKKEVDNIGGNKSVKSRAFPRQGAGILGRISNRVRGVGADHVPSFICHLKSGCWCAAVLGSSWTPDSS